MARSRSEKFIPDSDSEFLSMARKFAHAVARDPARFMLTSDDAATIDRATKRFDDAFKVVYSPATRTSIARGLKDKARAEAERVIRMYGNLIRANPQIDL